MAQKYDLDDIVRTYVKIRDTLAADRRAFKQKEAEYKEQMAALGQFLREHMEKMGVESIKTEHGTAFSTTKTSVAVQDWDTALAFIQANDAWQLLNRSVNKTAVEEFISETGQPPPGVKRDKFIEVEIRRPRAAKRSSK